jgi:hypothetical protein
MKKSLKNSHTLGFYHNPKSCQFAHLVSVGNIKSEDINKVKLIIGGDFCPTPDKKMSWLTFDTVKDVRHYLKLNGFQSVNPIIILCSERDTDELLSDDFFWERVSRVYGAEATSIVYYSDSGYNTAGLGKLGYWRAPQTWVWYGNKVDPALDTWLHEQIVEEVATLAFNAEKFAYDDVYQDRVVRTSRLMYGINDDGNRQLFQYEEGNLIEF